MTYESIDYIPPAQTFLIFETTQMWCEVPTRSSINTKEQPDLVEGNVLLKGKRVGICGTDLHAFKCNQAFFTYPRIPGHELAGGSYGPIRRQQPNDAGYPCRCHALGQIARNVLHAGLAKQIVVRTLP
jgi:hypothetical protein